MKNNKYLPSHPLEVAGTIYLGLTKREHIAAMILQGLVTNNGITSSSTTPQELSAKALLITDELLNQLEI